MVTWSVLRPDTDSLIFPTTYYTGLEKQVESTADVLPPAVNFVPSEPFVAIRKLEGFFRDNRTVAKERALPASLQSALEYLIQS